ncbi:MAG: response regulator transcription factor [Gracilibacteraceae bacterium]|jgi:DNA-binding response OmpR family regulator|nr:response regulator transcription factor [Gracilibacteraceae bacterium]
MSGGILLVEDNEQIQANNKSILKRHGYEVRIAMTLAQARSAIAESAPDVIVLDITMPDGSGLDFLHELRQTSQVPVLLLTAMSGAENTTAGLDAGADDYLSKPYDVKVLRARVDALLRRSRRMSDKIDKGRFKLDIVSGQAFVDGKDLKLSQKEFSILLLFVRHEGETINAETIYAKVWGAPMAGDRNAVQVTLARLKKKLEPYGCDIDNMRGQGYAFKSN